MLTFSVESYQKIKEKSVKNLTHTAKDSLHLLSEVGKLKKKQKKKKGMKIVLLEDQLQELIADTCGIFQLYFYKNLFEPSADSKIINYEFLTKKPVATLLNETFSTNKGENEEKMQIFARNNL